MDFLMQDLESDVTMKVAEDSTSIEFAEVPEVDPQETEIAEVLEAEIGDPLDEPHVFKETDGPLEISEIDTAEELSGKARTVAIEKEQQAKPYSDAYTNSDAYTTEKIEPVSGEQSKISDFEAESDLQDAIAATVDRVPDPKDWDSKLSRANLYSSSCGTLGEELCIRSTGSICLDTAVKNNFENFDTANSEEFASVKSHIVGNENNAIGTYAADLRTAIGARNPEKLEKAAASIWEAKQDPEQWANLKDNLPPSIIDAGTPEETIEAMREVTTLRVPVDHLPKVRNHLDRNVSKAPELYGIQKDLSPQEIEAQLEALKTRVRPINENTTSHDMRIAAKEVFQTKLDWKRRHKA